MQHQTIALKIFNSLADGNDGTLDVMGYDLPAYGYFVGGDGEPLVFDSAEDANRPDALRAIERFVSSTPARYVGWWTDQETGKVYVDGTTWFRFEADAGRVGRERREIAIYDAGNQRELRLVYIEGE